MYVLTVDTSTSYVVAGIVEVSDSAAEVTSGEQSQVSVLAERVVDNPRGHMELLTPNIVDCLAEAGLSPEQLGAVVVGVGPGPFTGLRVGMATAQAFADALSIPVHGVESTAAMAVRSILEQRRNGVSNLDESAELHVLADARRREWYWASYALRAGDNSTDLSQCTLETLREPAVDKPAAIVPQLPAGSPVVMGKTIADDSVDCVSDADAQPSSASLVIAALLARGGVNQRAVRSLRGTGEPLRALYLRRPDAIEPKPKPVPTSVDFGAVSGEQDGDKQDREHEAAGAELLEPRVVMLDRSHAEAMEKIEHQLFVGDSPWSLAGIQHELDAMNTQYFGLITEDQLVGYLGLAKNGPSAEPEWEIHTVAIAEQQQGRGYAHRLLRAALDAVDAAGGPVFLEVRTDNDPAVGLYERYGFYITGTRKNYYQPSGADAFTMMRPASGEDVDASQFHGADPRKKAARQNGQNSFQPVFASQSAEDSSKDEAVSSSRVILGVESSCDETGVGIVELTTETTGPQVRMISNRVASSMEQHARFGGVVPEIASRAHLEAMGPTMREALRDLRKDRAARGMSTSYMEKPDAVAATIGPGLAGALLVGAAAAKAYAAAWQVPFYAVNHLGGHVAVDLLAEQSGQTERAEAPAEQTDGPGLDNVIALLVSGGHTQILHVQGVGKPMQELGSTLDDAAGEAYDKVARLLGLGYPGGPIIDRLAQQGNRKAIAFPRGMMRQQDSRYDFSFSGLKTAVARHVEKAEKDGISILVEDVCASFQEAVCDVLTFKAVRAAQDVGATTMLLGGGVSANSRLRGLLADRCSSAGIQLHVPPMSLCTDNGVMIAALAAQLIAAGAEASELTVGTDPGLEVEVPLV